MIPEINLDYTRDITPKRGTSGGGHFRGLVPEQHNSEETSQRWRHFVRFDQPKNRTSDFHYDSAVLNN